MEIWKDVPNYEGLYQVSNLGRVKSIRFNKERILKAGVSSTGYLIVVLCVGKPITFAVHRLVAATFINSDFNGLVVDHINTIKTDNRVSNLQLVTHRENLSKDKKGASKFTGVHWAKRDKRWISRISIGLDRKYLGSFVTELEAANAYQAELKKLS